MSRLCTTELRSLTSVLSPHARRGGLNQDRRDKNLGSGMTATTDHGFRSLPFLSQRETMKMRDWLAFAVQDDSSPSPSPRARRRGIRNLISGRISNRAAVSFLLSLLQRERIKVRDCSPRVLQAPTKWPQERYRVLHVLDGSKSGQWQFLVWLGIPLASHRASRAGGNHDRNHPIRSQASVPDNRNPRRKDRSDAVVGIYKQRTFDFEDGARECVHNLLRFCGGNGGASSKNFLIRAVSWEKRNYRPLTLILSPRAGRGGLRPDASSKEFHKRRRNAMTEWNTERTIATDPPSLKLRPGLFVRQSLRTQMR
jgi:hypothetical protein